MPSNKDRLLMALSVGFFGAACLLFLAVLYDGTKGRFQKNSAQGIKNPEGQRGYDGDEKGRSGVGRREQDGTVRWQMGRERVEDKSIGSKELEQGVWRARPRMVELLEFQKTPFLTFGGLRYQILGVSQDEGSKGSFLWVRSLTSQRVGKFALGDQLFGGPVKIVAMSTHEIRLSYRGRDHAIPLGV